MEEEEKNRQASHIRVHMNIAYLHIVFTIFILLITLAPNFLKENELLSMQIVLAIPLLFSSIFARSRSVYVGKDTALWKNYGFLCFLVAYTLLVNSVGILLALFAKPMIVYIFFFANITLAETYSLMEIIERKEKIAERIWKDGLFIILLIFLGLLPALKIY